MNAPTPDGSGSEARGRSGASRDQLPRTRRITNSREIRAIFQKGKRSRTAHLDVFDSVSPLSFPRMGVVVPKHRRNSVERNRLKRRLREILRRDILPRLAERNVRADILIRARKEAYLATFSQLQDQLVAWAEKKWLRAS